MSVLGIEDLRVSYATRAGRREVVHGVGFEVGEGEFRDADGRHGLVFGVRPEKVLSFGKDPYAQTRYRFAAE